MRKEITQILMGIKRDCSKDNHPVFCLPQKYNPAVPLVKAANYAESTVFKTAQYVQNTVFYRLFKKGYRSGVLFY